MRDPSSKLTHLEVRQTDSTYWISAAGVSIADIDSALFEFNKDNLRPSGGRGEAQYVTTAFGQAVLRHYRRGGRIAWLLKDRYWWPGQVEHTRAYQEFQLTEMLFSLGLPVPKPLAARVIRDRFWYRSDLLTKRIMDTMTLAESIKQTGFSGQPWHSIMTCIARFHAAGINHADLNAHNVLIDSAGNVFLIDFDRSKRADSFGHFAPKNLARFLRSLNKLAQEFRIEPLGSNAVQKMTCTYEAFKQDHLLTSGSVL